MTKIEDLKTLEKTFDWSFSTPFKGSIAKFSQVSKFINDNEIELDQIIKHEEIKTQSKHEISLDYKSEKPIPLEMLG
jgi:hypothetical protein